MKERVRSNLPPSHGLPASSSTCTLLKTRQSEKLFGGGREKDQAS